MKKWMMVAALCVVLGAGGFYRWKASATTAEEGGTTTLAAVKVERGPIQQEVACSGSVISNLDVEIKCKSTGQIVELPYDISDPVEKGALLLKIDPVDEERTVRQAQVKVESAEAKLARAKQSLVVSEQELANSRREAHATLKAAEASSKDLREKAHRMQTLREKKYATTEETETAEASAIQADSTLDKAGVGIDALKVQEGQLELLRQDIKLAQADVDSYKIDLETALQRLKETKVYAPAAGVISSRLVQIGQIISSPTQNVSGGTSLLTLSDLSRVFVNASVDESDIGQVRPKQTASITVDAFPDEHFKGEVVRVATQGAKVSNVVTFEVKIEVLDEAKNRLLPKMTADVKILVASKDSALTIPCEAVKRRGPEKIVLVPAATGTEPTPVVVKTGIEDGTRTEILAGVDEGATIVIAQDAAEKKKASSEERKGIMGGPPPGGGGPPPM